jgi:signal transduction histidine kinase
MTCGTAPGTLVVETRNDGEIDGKVLPVIFEPLRGSDSGRGRAIGLGLGLYIAREIIQAHGGAIRVTSAAGSTVFRIELPRSARAPDQEHRP